MKKSPDPADAPKLERSFFFILLALLTVGFAAVILPFYGAVFWGAVLALMFEPLYRKLLARMRGRPNLAALATLGVILLLVILPLALVGVSLVQEATGVYARVKSGELDFGRYFEKMVSVMPGWLTGLLDRWGVVDVSALQAKIVAALSQRGSALAGRAVDIGGEALDLIVGFAIAMYLLFFLLRDGAGVAREVRAAIPLAPEPKERLLERFTTVIRATVKGNILVAAAQGTLGGLAFWALGVHAPMLWGVVMAFLSLLVIEISGMKALGFKGYMQTIFFLPPGLPPVLKPVMLAIMTPVEIISKLAKPFALAVRLFANMTAGHVVVLALIGLTFFFKSYVVGAGSSVLATAIMMLELFVAFLQAFVFTLLTAVFIGLIRESH